MSNLPQTACSTTHNMMPFGNNRLVNYSDNKVRSNLLFPAVLYPSNSTSETEILASARRCLETRFLSSSKFVPPPRLVGIETNPGPPRKEVVMVSTSAPPPSTRRSGGRRRQRRRRGKRSSGAHGVNQTPVNASLAAYRRVLIDPFFAPPIKLGFGTFVPTSIRSAWVNYSPAVGNTDTNFVIIATPFTNVASNAGTTYSAPSFIQYTGATSSATSVSMSGNTFNGTAAQNQSSFASMVDTSRVIAGALRFNVRYAATTLRGSLFAFYVGDDSQTALGTKTYANLSSVYAARRCTSSASGEIGGEVQYRPVDPSSFSMVPNWSASSFGSSTNIPQLVIVGVGWTAGTFQIEISSLFHYETLSGLDVSADDADINTLAANGVTIDQLGASMSNAGEPVITDLANLTAVDLAIQGLANADHARHGRGARMFSTAISSAGNGIFGGASSSRWM